MMSRFDLAGFQRSVTRRTFLSRSALGLGGLALASLIEPRLLSPSQARAAEGHWRGVVNPVHFPAKVKRVIHLCMAGGPSQFETLDYEPKLKELDGQPFPESFTR